jgi:hypothetical protein
LFHLILESHDGRALVPIPKRRRFDRTPGARSESFCSWSTAFLKPNGARHVSKTWWAGEDSNLQPDRYIRTLAVRISLCLTTSSNYRPVFPRTRTMASRCVTSGGFGFCPALILSSSCPTRPSASTSSSCLRRLGNSRARPVSLQTMVRLAAHRGLASLPAGAVAGR